jgi:hypothetical protein
MGRRFSFYPLAKWQWQAAETSPWAGTRGREPRKGGLGWPAWAHESSAPSETQCSSWILVPSELRVAFFLDQE